MDEVSRPVLVTVRFLDGVETTWRCSGHEARAGALVLRYPSLYPDGAWKSGWLMLGWNRIDHVIVDQ